MTVGGPQLLRAAALLTSHVSLHVTTRPQVQAGKQEGQQMNVTKAAQVCQTSNSTTSYLPVVE